MTLAPTVTIHSNSFDPVKTAKSVLCMEVGRDRFRFLVQDSRRKASYLEDYTFPSLLTERTLTEVLPDVFRSHPILSAGPWQEIRIGVNSPSFTIVPKPLFRKEYASSYLSLMRGSALPAHEFAQSYVHENEDFLSIFNLEHPLVDYFSGTYPLQPSVFIHQIGSLIQATAELDRHLLTTHNVWLYFEDEFVSLLFRKEKRLLYCNRFGYKNAQDLAYYVLYVFDELGLHPEEAAIFLYGEITPFAESYTMLSRFLPKLSFGHSPSSLKLADEFDDLPEHRYLSLYGLSLLSE